MPALQALLSITNSWNLPKPMAIESVMPSNHLILCHPLLLLPSVFQSFPVSQLFTSGGQSIGASASVLPMNIQGWFPLGLTGLISLQSKDSQESFLALQFESISSSVLRLLYGPTVTLYMTTGKTIALIIHTFVNNFRETLKGKGDRKREGTEKDA